MARPPSLIRRWTWRRSLKIAAALGLLLLLLGGVGFLAARRLAVPPYRGADRINFDGEVFLNQVPIAEHGLGNLFKWLWRRDGKAWRGYSDEPVHSAVVKRVHGTELRVTVINHATVLIQTAGLNFLTDPIWSERASPVSWAGPRRHVAPGIAFEDLPPIDYVLVSHNHYDHLDLPTLARLAEVHAPRIYLPLGNTALLEEHGIPGGHDMDWWEELPLTPEVTLWCVAAQHFSGRSFADRDTTLWGGFVIDGPGGAVYFAGDTGVGLQFAQINVIFDEPRLTILPIGAYEPRWFMRDVHMNPRETAEAHLQLDSRQSLAIHYGCFRLADEGPTQPLADLDAALEELGIPADEFWRLRVGEARDVPAVPNVRPSRR